MANVIQLFNYLFSDNPVVSILASLLIAFLLFGVAWKFLGTNYIKISNGYKGVNESIDHDYQRIKARKEELEKEVKVLKDRLKEFDKTNIVP